MQHNPSFIPVTPDNKTIGLATPAPAQTFFPTAVGNDTLRLVNVPTPASRPAISPQNVPYPTISPQNVPYPAARNPPFEFPRKPVQSPFATQTRMPSLLDVFDSDSSTEGDFDTDTDTDAESDDEYYTGFPSPSSTTFSPIVTTPSENKLPLFTYPRLGTQTVAPLPPGSFPTVARTSATPITRPTASRPRGIPSSPGTFNISQPAKTPSVPVLQTGAASLASSAIGRRPAVAIQRPSEDVPSAPNLTLQATSGGVATPQHTTLNIQGPPQQMSFPTPTPSQQSQVPMPTPSRQSQVPMPTPSRQSQVPMPTRPQQMAFPTPTPSRPSQQISFPMPTPSRQSQAPITKPSQQMSFPMPSQQSHAPIPKPSQQMSFPMPSQQSQAPIPNPSQQMSFPMPSQQMSFPMPTPSQQSQAPIPKPSQQMSFPMPSQQMSFPMPTPSQQSQAPIPKPSQQMSFPTPTPSREHVSAPPQNTQAPVPKPSQQTSFPMPTRQSQLHVPKPSQQISFPMPTRQSQAPVPNPSQQISFPMPTSPRQSPQQSQVPMPTSPRQSPQQSQVSMPTSPQQTNIQVPVAPQQTNIQVPVAPRQTNIQVPVAPRQTNIQVPSIPIRRTNIPVQPANNRKTNIPVQPIPSRRPVTIRQSNVPVQAIRPASPVNTQPRRPEVLPQSPQRRPIGGTEMGGPLVSRRPPSLVPRPVIVQVSEQENISDIPLLETPGRERLAIEIPRFTKVLSPERSFRQGVTSPVLTQRRQTTSIVDGDGSGPTSSVHNGEQDEYSDCCICLEPEIVSPGKKTRCKHSICRECTGQLRTENCPMCRGKLEGGYVTEDTFRSMADRVREDNYVARLLDGVYGVYLTMDNDIEDEDVLDMEARNISGAFEEFIRANPTIRYGDAMRVFRDFVQFYRVQRARTQGPYSPWTSIQEFLEIGRQILLDPNLDFEDFYVDLVSRPPNNNL